MGPVLVHFLNYKIFGLGDNMKSCFFIGHREASSEVLPALMEAIEQHIVEYSVTEFIVGNYGGFDHIAAKAVIAAKERHPGITLSMLIPNHPAERSIEPPQGFDNRNNTLCGQCSL